MQYYYFILSKDCLQYLKKIYNNNNNNNFIKIYIGKLFNIILNNFKLIKL